MDENDFLRAILTAPKDDALLLVYSDWLEEQGDPASADKAEFLRVTTSPGDEKARRRRLQVLAASIDTGWLAVVSRLQIENCQGKRKEAEMRPFRFDFLCDRQWQDLRPTDDHGVRYCDGCEQNVHYCDTITTAREHAEQGHCVAVDLGVIRRKEDLRARMYWMGRPSVESLRRENELAEPDPVSAERERRKREAGGTP